MYTVLQVCMTHVYSAPSVLVFGRLH